MSEPKWVTVNMNDKAKVRLTDDGLAKYMEHERELNKLIEQVSRCPRGLRIPETDITGYSTFQLWVLMNIFGDGMQWGGPLYFANNEIVMEVR